MLLIGNKTLEELIKNRACVLRNKYPVYTVLSSIYNLVYKFCKFDQSQGSTVGVAQSKSHISGIDRLRANASGKMLKSESLKCHFLNF